MPTSLACLIASLAIVEWTIRYLGSPFLVSQLIVAATIPAISFLLSTLWIFEDSSSPKQGIFPDSACTLRAELLRQQIRLGPR